MEMLTGAQTLGDDLRIFADCLRRASRVHCPYVGIPSRREDSMMLSRVVVLQEGRKGEESHKTSQRQDGKPIAQSGCEKPTALLTLSVRRGCRCGFV